MNACSRLLLRGTARATRHANNNCTSSIGSLSVSTANRFQHSTSFHLPDPTISLPTESLNQPLVKVVATIGPTSEAAEPLLQCVQAGLNAMRLNFSHATPDEVELRCRNLHAANEYVTKQQYKGLSQLQDTVTILLDTKGPELRTGTLADDTSGHHTVALDQGATVTLHASASTMPNTSGGTATDLLIDFPPLASVLQPGRLVLLDDGAVVLTVHSVSADTNTIACTVQHSGSVRSRAGVNLPLANTAPHLPALSEQDQSDIAYGMTAADVDVVAASFVQTAQHVTDLRAHVASVAATLESYTSDPTKALPLIVSKIETASALENFDEILAVSDGIMVARGDLGVEIPLAQVTNAQKEMVAACNAAGKPVIVATQMMESMSKAPRPTRAEVSDVTNAVYDGADCVMLSGETAKGKYPVATIQTMKDIIRAAERFAIHQTEVAGKPVTTPTLFAHSPGTPVSAVAKAAVTAAHDTATSCAAIVVALPPPSAVGVGSFTPHPYHLAGLVAAHRPNVPVYVLCRSAKQARQLQLYRGLYPVVVGADTLASKTISSQTLLGHIPAGSSVVCVEQDTEDAAPAMTFCTVE